MCNAKLPSSENWPNYSKFSYILYYVCDTMDNEDQPRRGRPRRHSSQQERMNAYMRRSAGKGLIRVSVLVPGSKAEDLKAIAAAMRKTSAANRVQVPIEIDPAFPNAGRSWLVEDQATAVRSWQAGATAEDLTSALGRPLEEILQRLVKLEETGSVREAKAELDARARADRLYWANRSGRAGP